MSSKGSDHLEFRGTDLKECEQFIAAVNKHAHAQGKLRDDQWIADFVAISLAGDALIWWSLLDEGTQGSWRLLRQAMISRLRPLFYGTSGAEAEDFVQQIREKALDMGKLNDPRWTAEFASTRFRGIALRWYTALDPSVRSDWDSLQQAIFTQYGHEFKEDSTAAITPTPPLAAAPPVPHVPAKQRHRGRIRVCRKGDPAVYFLSKSSGACIFATLSTVEALEVEYELASTCDALQALTIPDDQIKGFDRLGMKWNGANTTLSNDFLFICGANSDSGIDSLGSFKGPLLDMPWRVSLSANERGAKSVTAIGKSGQSLAAVSPRNPPTNVWFRQANIHNEIDVELFFEPV